MGIKFELQKSMKTWIHFLSHLRRTSSCLVLIGLCFSSGRAQAGFECSLAFSKVSKSVTIADDEMGIFGYGSLLNLESLSKTLGRPYTGPVLQASLKGWVRTWDSILPNENWYHADTPSGRVVPKNLLYLNLQPKENAEVTGLIFVIKKSDLAKFDEREMVYDSKDVTSAVSRVAVKGGRVVTYVGKPEFIARPGATFPEVGLRQSYMNMVDRALGSFDSDFQAEFHATTAPAPDGSKFIDIPDF